MVLKNIVYELIAGPGPFREIKAKLDFGYEKQGNPDMFTDIVFLDDGSEDGMRLGDKRFQSYHNYSYPGTDKVIIKLKSGPSGYILAQRKTK